MSVKIATLQHLLKSSLCSAKNFATARDSLDALCRTCSESDLIAVDFKGITDIKPIFFLQLSPFLSSRSFSFALVNLADDLHSSVLVAAKTTQRLNTSQFLWPVLSSSGLISWIGSFSPQDESSLSFVFNGGSCQGTSTLARTFSANPVLFTKVPESSNWRASDSVSELYDLLKAQFSQWFEEYLSIHSIRKSAHVILPSGRHSNNIFQMGLLVNEPMALSALANEIVRRFRCASFNAIVCSSLAAITLSRYISHIYPDLSIYPAYGYPSPIPQFPFHFDKNTRVLILVDAMTTGMSANNLYSLVVSHGANVIGALALVDATGVSVSLGFQSLASFHSETYSCIKDCPQCSKNNKPTRIDPFTSFLVKPRSHFKAPRSILKPDAFWKVVLDNDALLEGHWSFNGHHFSTFIQTHKVFRNRTTCSQLAFETVNCFTNFFSCIVCPAHESAVTFAGALREQFSIRFAERSGPALVPLSKTEAGNYTIPEHYVRTIRQGRILVVDDGANYGDTLMNISFALEDVHAKDIHYVVFVDRLSPVSRRKLIRILGANSLTSLFHLDLPPYRPWECPICREQRELNTKLGASVGKRLSAHWEHRQAQLALKFVDAFELKYPVH
jgi:orotate phosphoribosyltransferase